jgi:hypothetical protein
MPAVRGNTLAPWVLRVDAATSHRASSRAPGRPDDRRATGRRAQAGRGMRAPLIPAPTSMPPTIGTRPAGPLRSHANAPPRPVRRPLRPGRDHRPAVPDHRLAVPCRAAPRRPRPGAAPGPLRPCPRVAGPGPPRPCRPLAAPDRPQPRRPGAGQPRSGHLAAGRPGAAQAHPRPCRRRPGHLGAEGQEHPRPVAGGRGAPPGPARPCPLGIARGRPRPCRRAAPPAPGTAVPGR